ncbi:unnamed protein product [Closterium sp. NIES-65]|nr:unnamed protein product [Closterium sp. NIES-65]
MLRLGGTGAAGTGGSAGAGSGAAGAGTAGGAAGAGAAGGAAGAGAAGGAAGAGAIGGAAGGAAVGAAGARAAGGAAGAGAARGAAGAGAAPGVGAGGATTGAGGGAAGVVAGHPGAEGVGAVSAGSGGAARPRPYYVPLLQQRVPLTSPPASSLLALADPESDSLRATSPTVTHVLEDRQEEFECFGAALSHLVSMLIAPEGDLDAPDILTPRSLRRGDRGSLLLSVAMTTLRVLLHVAAQRDYELHSLDFSTAFLQGSLHEEIWLCRPPVFTGSFPPGT